MKISPLKTMWPLLDLLLNGRLKKIKCSRSTPRVYRNSDRGFLYFRLITIFRGHQPIIAGDIRTSGSPQVW